MKKVTIALLVLVLLAYAAPTFAQSGGSTPTPSDILAICAQLSAQNGVQYHAVEHPQYGSFDCATGLQVGGTTSSITPTGPGTLPASATSGWQIQFSTGATQQMQGVGPSAWPSFPALAPNLWPIFPNVDNPAANFSANNGLEYGMAEHQFCGTVSDECSIVVAAGSYALITGSYNIPELGISCEGDDRTGCALMLVNVGNVSAEFSGTYDNVYVVTGRYWNGDKLPIAMVAALSHATNSMANLQSQLNPSGSTNAGANCSVRSGCENVHNQFTVTSGSEKLIEGSITFRR